MIYIKNNNGFTIIELIISMAVFIVIIAIAGETFNNITSLSLQYSRSEESNIEGVIGLEVLRHDLEQMGFGLPWRFQAGATISYNEATSAPSSTNDSTNGVPRAFVGFNTFGTYSSDYIGIKAATVGVSKTSQRWTYIAYKNFSTATGRESRPVAWPSNNLQVNDQVVSIRSNFNDESDDHVLMDKAGTFAFNFQSNGIDSAFLPQTDQQTHMVYGLDPTGHRMPFNRADFFVKLPDLSTGGQRPTFCSERTGVLYKAVISQADGSYMYMPLLDCVANMQVVLGWDSSDGGLANSVDSYSSLPDNAGIVSATGPAGIATKVQGWLGSAEGVRNHLKLIKVYILAQDGRYDRNYRSPTASYVIGNQENGELSLTRQYVLSDEQKHYRWKLYRVIARPKNLASNQR